MFLSSMQAKDGFFCKKVVEGRKENLAINYLRLTLLLLS
jgi:hypothetical protein